MKPTFPLIAVTASLIACTPPPGAVVETKAGGRFPETDPLMRNFIPKYRVGMKWSYRFYPIGASRAESEQDPNRSFSEEVASIDGQQVFVKRPYTPEFTTSRQADRPYFFAKSSISYLYTFQATEDVTVPYGVVKNAYRFVAQESALPFLDRLSIPVPRGNGSSEQLVWFATGIGAVKSATVYHYPDKSEAATDELVSFQE